MNSKAELQPDIIDNRKLTMSNTLNLNIPKIEFFDVSTGYFYVDGYDLIRNTLEEAVTKRSMKFRLLVGQDTIKSKTHDTFEDYRKVAESEELRSMKDILDNQDLNTHGMDVTTGLINLLRCDHVQIRHNNRRFNHSKCYILGNSGAIVGSSNFTQSGMQGNDELNVGIYQTASWEKIKEWFERMWDKAQDAKADMISVLEQSKFGIPPDPYDIYMKMLFEKHKPILLAMKDIDSSKLANLAVFQKDAVTAAAHIIASHGGVIIADSTGLGKTHIGLEIIRQKIFKEDRKILLIAPSQVLETVWKDKLTEARIVVKMVTMESLGRETFEDELHKYRKFDTIVVDESQNFRSKLAARRETLMKLMTLGKKKQAILLTATPINNSIMDLYYQLSIITKNDDGHFANIGIPDLYTHMRKAANDGIENGIEQIQHILDQVMVRRTRSFIKEMYPNETLNNKPVKFPKHSYAEIRYSVTDLFDDAYDNLLNTIEKLNMVPYGIERYNTTASREEKQKHASLARLQLILLLKRFESSSHAVKTSIDNKIRLYEYFKKILSKGLIIRTRELNKIIAKWNIKEVDSEYDEEEQDKFIVEEIKKIPTQLATNYDVETMKQKINDDLKLLTQYKNYIEKMLPFDKKFDAVSERIQKDKALENESKKVLIFTEYTTTAKHLNKKMKEKFPDKKVGLITGSVNKNDRQTLIKRFSPESNSVEDEELPSESIDILISTEVLSEGQNLQDCNYVINYDLPWNPMRIVQRMGRIDRLTSKYDTVYSRACFPDKKLDKLLRLVGRLIEKIDIVNQTIGLDTPLLGEEATPKQFNGTTANRIRIFAGMEGSAEQTIAKIERESDLMPNISPINEINRHIKESGFEQMLNVPMGRRSGKKDSENVVIMAYLQEKPDRLFHIVLFDYTTKKATVIEDNVGFTMAKCAPQTPKYLPMDDNTHAESFKQLLEIDKLARTAIVDRMNSDNELAELGRQKRRSTYNTNVSNIKEIMTRAVMDGSIPKETAKQVCSIIDISDMRAWENNISDILSDYNVHKNINNMVTELDKIAKRIGVSENSTKNEKMIKPTESDMNLVAAMFITGDNHKPKTIGET